MSVKEIESKEGRPSTRDFSRWFEQFLAETKDAGDMPDEQELARRRQLLQEIDELRAEITRHSGVHPDSTPTIREMRAGREV